MFNSILNTVRNTFSKPQAIVGFGFEAEEDFDFDAEYEAMIQEEREGYEAEQAQIRADWAALSDREREEYMDHMDEMAAGGYADECRYYPFWKARRCV